MKCKDNLTKYCVYMCMCVYIDLIYLFSPRHLADTVGEVLKRVGNKLNKEIHIEAQIKNVVFKSENLPFGLREKCKVCSLLFNSFFLCDSKK